MSHLSQVTGAPSNGAAGPAVYAGPTAAPLVATGPLSAPLAQMPTQAMTGPSQDEHEEQVAPGIDWSAPPPAAALAAPQGGYAVAAGEIPGEQAHMLGMSALLVGGGALAGARLGGLYGGIAGSLFGGSASNALRAVRYAMLRTEEGKREALISGTYAVLTGAFAGWVAFKIDTKRKRKGAGA